MKYILALLTLTVAAVAAETIPSSGLYLDLYCNLFKDGRNLNRKVGDYVRDPADFIDGPALDAAVADVALRGRQYIAAQMQAAQKQAAAQLAAKEEEKQATVSAANDVGAAAISANVADLAVKTERTAALEDYFAQLTAYIAGLRRALDERGVPTQPPPSAPAP